MRDAAAAGLSALAVLAGGTWADVERELAGTAAGAGVAGSDGLGGCVDTCANGGSTDFLWALDVVGGDCDVRSC